MGYGGRWCGTVACGCWSSRCPRNSARVSRRNTWRKWRHWSVRMGCGWMCRCCLRVATSLGIPGQRFDRQFSVPNGAYSRCFADAVSPLQYSNLFTSVFGPWACTRRPRHGAAPCASHNLSYPDDRVLPSRRLSRLRALRFASALSSGPARRGGSSRAVHSPPPAHPAAWRLRVPYGRAVPFPVCDL